MIVGLLRNVREAVFGRPMTPGEMADVIERSLSGTAGPRDWDDFMFDVVRSRDVELRRLFRKAEDSGGLVVETEYEKNAEARDALHTLARMLREIQGRRDAARDQR